MLNDEWERVISDMSKWLSDGKCLAERSRAAGLTPETCYGLRLYEAISGDDEASRARWKANAERFRARVERLRREEWPPEERLS